MQKTKAVMDGPMSQIRSLLTPDSAYGLASVSVSSMNAQSRTEL
jgi:hypothetical protein